jgi:hypothetical protein
MLITAPGAFSATGTVYALSGSGTTWTFVQTISPPGGGSTFAQGVGVSGNTAVVTSSPANVATDWVFVKQGLNWFLQGTAITLPAGAGSFSPVAIDGTTFLAGGSVAAYVYATAGGSPQTLLASDQSATDPTFGSPVAISGDTLLVGAEPSDSSGQTAHWGYIFVRSGATWSQQAKLVPSDLLTNNNPHFNFSFGIDGDTAVMATSGGVYVFTRSGTTWTQSQKIAVPSTAVFYGTAVALKGNLLVVTDASISGDPGRAFVYGRSNGTWILGPTLTSGVSGDTYGTSVGLGGGTVVIGATSGNQPVSSGGAFIYSCFP